ncbi:hypothetical protein JD276_07450 [Leucobacter sp. CSA1]|uniref:Ribosomally synthesized peptide with SipW-like signal peptide n=1 Tax=Leucobacter chromiisoli TaxID=2796471 RepID=A0A934UUW8_9MICO|nr:SipW-dependent-type signal peptide-containing protein [Leucobacter chromiisoli]MBK0418866.1 hypothetical protein [Leucobacter chromiisoli]
MSSRRTSRHASPRQRPSTLARVRALLAGALVLGVGGTATLAAWTDEERATATVTAGTFALQSRVGPAPTPWANHTTTAAALPLSAAGLYPGQSRAAWIQIQNTGSVAGTVNLSGVTFASTPAPGSNHERLRDATRVRISATAADGAASNAPSCTTSTPGTEVTGLQNVPALTAQPLKAASANTVTYCVVITLSADAPNEAQGGSVTPTWTFTGSTPTS